MTALQLLDPGGEPTGVLVEQYPGSRATMTGSAVTVSGFVQNQAVMVTNGTNDLICVRSDGTAAVLTGASMPIVAGAKDLVVVQHAGGTVSLIGVGTTGYVYLTPIKTS